jgi:hypothetical protein
MGRRIAMGRWDDSFPKRCGRKELNDSILRKAFLQEKVKSLVFPLFQNYPSFRDNAVEIALIPKSYV